MAAPGRIALFVERLEALELPYVVTGSVASMIYGEPRLTLDVKPIRDIRAMLASDPPLDRGSLADELRRRGLDGAWNRVTEAE